MDEELRLEIARIVSLAHGPKLLEPNFEPKSDSQPSKSKAKTQPTSSKRKSTTLKDSSVSSSKKKQCKPVNVPPSKKNRKYLGMKANELHFQMEDDKVVAFCQENGLVAKNVICSCGNLMQLAPKTVDDAYEWTCHRKSHKVKPYQTIRKGTWFENAKIAMADILWIAYMWVHEYSTTSMLHECENPQKTLFDWCESCLDMCREIMEHKKDPIGGKDRSVEIFECKILKDKKPVEKWAFCAIEQYSTNILHLIIDDKKSYSLFQVFNKFLLPGTKVITHNWSCLKNINHGDYIFLTRERSISFFDQLTKQELDTFEDFKRITSRPPPGLNKWSKLEYGASFFEKMYRKCLTFAPDAYLTFLKDVSVVYKPVDKLVKLSKKVGDKTVCS